VKRQIIRTKSERPYRVARLIIGLVIVALAVLLALELAKLIELRRHATNASAFVRTVVRQDFAFAHRNSQNPAFPV
jgi:hypothetical protein